MGFNYNEPRDYDYPYRGAEAYLAKKKTKAKPRAKKSNLDKIIAELEAVLARTKILLQVAKKMKRKEKQA
jgi:hypothetical protein